MKIFESRCSSASSSVCSTTKRIGKSAAALQSRTCWWVIKQIFVWKAYSKVQSRLIGLDRDWRLWVPPSSTQWKVERIQVVRMSLDTCLPLSPGARLFVLAPLVPWLLASFVVLLRIRGFNWHWLTFTEINTATPVFFSATRTSHRDSTYCTLSFNCVQVQILPTAQVTPVLTDSFFLGVMCPTLTLVRPGL